MLINKGVSSGDIVTIKLTSGEELVAKLIEENPMQIKIARPLVLTMGQQGIGMVPYLFTVDPDKDIKMSRSTITVLETTEDSAAKQYIKATTGIVTYPMQIKIARPLVLTMGQQGIGMVPYLFTVDPDKDIKMSKSTITVLETTEDSAAKQYIKATTGIVT